MNMIRCRAVAFLLIAGVIALIPIVTLGQSIRTGPKPATVITGCGTKITSPGTYVLTGYVTGCDRNGVEINSGDVTLDMGGFGFDTGCIGGCYRGQTGILVADPAGGQISNVKILRGAAQDFDIGMSFVAVKRSQVTGVFLGNYSTTCLTLNSNARGDTSHNNLFTADGFGGCGEGVQGNSVYNTKFIGNHCNGLGNNTGTGIHILHGSGNILSGNNCGALTVAVDLGSDATGNSVFGNQFFATMTGILIESGSGKNTFRANYLWHNNLDIDEENTGCGSDVWMKNVFDRSNQDCVH